MTAGPRTQATIGAALRAALEPPWADDEIRLITLPAPLARPERLLGLDDEGPAAFWSPPDGPSVAGLGAAATVRGAGPDRAAEVSAAADRLWPRLRLAAAGDVAPVRPRLFGGLAFLPDASAPPWEDFGPATFVLPRLVYEAGADGSRLAVAVSAEEFGREGAEPVIRLVRSALTAVSEGPGDAAAFGAGTAGIAVIAGIAGIAGAAGTMAEPRSDATARSGPPTAVAAEAVTRSDWARIVESIKQRIGTGRAEKIVAARVHELRLTRPLDLVAVLGRLETGPREARFAFRFGRTVFLGATPERLVAVRGLEVRTEAVAGSIEAGGADGAGRLRASLKDDEEHRLVVQAIAVALAPLCRRLDYPSEPDIARLRHVLHLRTPFVGTLARPVPVLDLVARLHPTPAVGGTPTAEALDWIAREEPGCRGWYAGPVGWFDADGDGDFAVALRSALVDGRRALLYAGAGIVRDSDVDAELAETDVKLRTMLDVLEVDG